MAGTWQGLVNQPPFHTSTMFLLTDGRVMAREEATAPGTIIKSEGETGHLTRLPKEATQ